MENQHYKSYEQAALDILRGKQPEEEVEEQEQVEEAAVHPDALHVKPVKMNGQTKYKVHAVGSNFSSGIKPGEHLSDSELDDFSEMGGKIKHMKEEAEELDEVIRNDPLLMKVGPIVSRDNTTGRSSPEEQQQGKENLKRAVKASIARMKTDRKPRLPEQVEEIEEMGPGKLPRIDKKVENEYGEKLMKDFLAKGGEVKQVKSPALPKNRNRMVARGSLSSGERTMTKSGGKSYTSRMEEVEEDYDQLIEEKNAFEIELPEQLIFADYLKAAKMYTESYNDAVIIADHFFASNDEGLVIEAFMRSDIEDRVKMHQKAGNETTMPKYSTKDGKPHAEYIVTDKDSGKKTKYIHHGTMRRVERMN